MPCCRTILTTTALLLASSPASAADSWLARLSTRVDHLLRENGLKSPYSWTLAPGQAPVLTAQTVIDDMGGPNDAPLLGVRPHRWAVDPVPAQIAMGTDTRGCKAPAWWLQSGANQAYKDCEPWTAFVQWFVVFEGEGNSADNVRVQVRQPRAWYLHKTDEQWKPLSTTDTTSWFLATKDDITWVDQPMDIQRSGRQDLAFLVERQAAFSYHGLAGSGPVDISQAVPHIKAIFTTVQARLVVDDPSRPDDIEQAVWLLQSGADYYPDTAAHAAQVLPPGVGLSRSKRLTRQWQSFSFATLANARQDYTGPARALSPEAFSANPPPFE